MAFASGIQSAPGTMVRLNSSAGQSGWTFRANPQIVSSKIPLAANFTRGVSNSSMLADAWQPSNRGQFPKPCGSKSAL
uniref:Uncharacterized protein n=1 Tax=mine drainage metagenome TaxID=410659 RepID=E6PWU9_9ZZZZ